MISAIEPISSQSAPAWRPLSIGSVEIGFPVVQAALSGYSDWAMRVIARRLGAPYALCEVMLDQFVIAVTDTPRRTAAACASTDEEHPVGGQLMGAEPERFRPAARAARRSRLRRHRHQLRLPGEESARPLPRRVSPEPAGSGAGNRRRVRDAVPPHVPVTVKMRRGIDDTAESRDKFFAIFDGAFAAASRRSPSTAAPSSSATSAPAAGSSCAK